MARTTSTINLIPPKIKLEQKIKRIERSVFLTIFVILLMTLLVYGGLYYAQISISTQLAKTKQELSETEMKVESLKDVENQINTINAKLTKITTLKKQNISWSDVIAKLNASTPEKVKINSFQADRTAKKLTINGAAETRRDIVKFQTKLDSIGYFANLSFSTSTYNETEQYYTFTLTGDIVK